MGTQIIKCYSTSIAFDSDALTYIQAVEAADGQALESTAQQAINTFVVGCKTNGIWNAIKACCILAGARTLTGALVPLKGSAPTNNGFVSGDYNRKTGLKGNASTKWLNSNRANNSEPQTNKHLSVWCSELDSSNGRCFIGSDGPVSGASQVIVNATNYQNRITYTGGAGGFSAGAIAVGLAYFDRTSESNVRIFANNTLHSGALTSATPTSSTISVFCRGIADRVTDARLAFYSIGESLEPSVLNTVLSQLMTDINSAF
jgi:hypothetical protein